MKAVEERTALWGKYALNGAEKVCVMRSDLVLCADVWQVLVYPV